MRSLRIPAIALTLIIAAASFTRADDDDPAVSQPQRAQQAYTQQVQTQQQRGQQRYYRRPQQQNQGFWSRMVELERRKNRFLLRMIGIGR